MDPTQNVPAPSPDSLQSTPEATGDQAHMDTVASPLAAEKAGVVMELPGASVQAAQAAVSGAHDAAAVPATPPPMADTTQPVTNTSANPVVASDDDLIEQEWVDRAKAIVDQTREDPYLQNKEINQFKADYIKKRYKRDIKVSEV